MSFLTVAEGAETFRFLAMDSFQKPTSSRMQRAFINHAQPHQQMAQMHYRAFIYAHSCFVMSVQGSGALQFPNGVPTSLKESGQQWDYPNAWPPLQHMLIDGRYHELHLPTHSDDSALNRTSCSIVSG